MSNFKLAAGDFETDPFLYGRKIKPFTAELCISETEYYQFWGKDCVEQFVAKLREIKEPLLIYFHNGGRFDLMLGNPCLLNFIDGDIKIINRRIVKCKIGIHEIRDSFAIFPEALSSFKGKFKKLEIDYALMEEDVREQHKSKILHYQHLDCLTLLENCQAFMDEFGDNLTIGGTAMRELKKFHKFEVFEGSDKAERDADFRQFFYGGRTQCFAEGIVKGKFKVFDVNGMYQDIMRTARIPLSAHFTTGSKIGPRTDFAIIEAENYGALPQRTKSGIDFTVERGVFHTTRHEIDAGEATATLKILRVLETRDGHSHGNFSDFIDHFYNARLRMKAAGELMRDSFYKRIMNAAYGKFAQNPEDYCDYCLSNSSENREDYINDGWRESERNGEWIIWERDSSRKQYLNVAIAASITGAARAKLLYGLSGAINPLYCDTDSIICSDLHGVEIDASKLGAWKQEGKKDANGVFHYDADSIAIAGKKLYSVFDGEFSMKMACKGVKISAEQIRSIARGEMIRFENPVPRFGLLGEQSFKGRVRNVRSTAIAGRIGREKIEQTSLD